jgi:hypothetical protein
MAESQASDGPMHWNILSDTDKADYRKLRNSFVTAARNRGANVDNIGEMLEAIRRYAEKGDNSDWKRCLVCGLCWLEDAIAMNTRQIRHLVAKCKSSVNGSLQRIGYLPAVQRSEYWQCLFTKIPCLKDNSAEIRQWTVRCRIPEYQSQQRTEPIIPIQLPVGRDMVYSGISTRCFGELERAVQRNLFNPMRALRQPYGCCQLKVSAKILGDRSAFPSIFEGFPLP